MQIIVCKLVALLRPMGNKATKPKPGAVAGTNKMLRHAGRIMKLTAILILGACLQIHATGLGQGITLTVKDAPIETVFKQVQKQTDYKFLYTSQLLEGAARVTLTVKNASVKEVLDECFKGQRLDYEIEEKMIVVRPKASRVQLTESLEATKSGEPIEVSGKVTDEEGRPLLGANVKVRGTNIGVTTDNNGNFVIRDVRENAVLEITFVGHEMKTFTVRKTGFFNIVLGQKLSLLDETVVIAYGTTTKRFATGNIASIKAADIEKQPVQNPLLALQGRVPGVVVTQLTGMPGGGVTVRIQGQNSIRSGLDPLIIIDGVPFPSQLSNSGFREGIVQGGSPLNYINPQDIESIDILKDADATAIYGSRAANGAILITTKKGKAGNTKLSFNLQQGWGDVARKVDMMKTPQYLAMRREALKNSGKVPSSDPSASEPFLYAPDIMFWDTTRDIDWQKELIGGTARYTSVNTGISGGTATMQYLIGGSYNRQTTVFPGDFDDKVGTLHFNINTATSNKRLRLQLSGNYSYDQNRLPGGDLTESAVLLAPNAPNLYNSGGDLNWAQDSTYNSTWWNPLAYNSVNRNFNNTTKALVSNATINYRIIPGLDLRSSFGYTSLLSSIYNTRNLEAFPPELRAYFTRRTEFVNRNMSSWIIEPQLQYTGKLGKGKIESLLGSTIQKGSSDYLSVDGQGFATDLLMKTLTAATSISSELSSYAITRFNGLFGRLNYNWDDKYLINLTARRDGSNKFGDKYKFHNFGSIGIGWIFSKEKWMEDQFHFFSFGKLRTSYGTTGNDQIPDFNYLSTYGISNPTVLYQGNIGLNVQKITNPYLQWEETHKWQMGLDLGFWQDRLVLQATYVNNRSSNQLILYNLPTLTGFNNIVKNFPATIENASWEIIFNSVNIKGRSFVWNTSFNLTIPHNKLVKFPGIELTNYASGNNGVIVGQPLGVIKVAHYAGVDPAIGKYLTMDKNGNPVTYTPSEEQKIMISPFAKYYGGLVNNFSYKGFQLDFIIQFVRKIGPRDMVYYNGEVYPGLFDPIKSNQPMTVAELNHWQKGGDKGPIGRYYPDFSQPTLTGSDEYYNYDASFVRLKNVSVSWQLPSAWLKKANLQNVRLYLHGQNLATITNYKGLDPETMSSTRLPPLRMITLGTQVDF